MPFDQCVYEVNEEALSRRDRRVSYDVVVTMISEQVRQAYPYTSYGRSSRRYNRISQKELHGNPRPYPTA
jgi:hypothetical protein